MAKEKAELFEDEFIYYTYESDRNWLFGVAVIQQKQEELIIKDKASIGISDGLNNYLAGLYGRIMAMQKIGQNCLTEK